MLSGDSSPGAVETGRSPEESFWSRNSLRSNQLGTDGGSHCSNSAESKSWILLILPSPKTSSYFKILCKVMDVEVIAWNFLVPSINTFPNMYQLTITSGNHHKLNPNLQWLKTADAHDWFKLGAKGGAVGGEETLFLAEVTQVWKQCTSLLQTCISISL